MDLIPVEHIGSCALENKRSCLVYFSFQIHIYQLSLFYSSIFPTAFLLIKAEHFMSLGISDYGVCCCGTASAAGLPAADPDSEDSA